ncbi:TonB-dependent receptor plug domain-containing protein [Candidatus Omnitrophota bacterium]
MFLKFLLLALSVFLLFFSSAIAGEVPAYNLGEITVAKEKSTFFGASSALEVIAQDIEDKNAQTVEEALDFIPGVRVTVGQKNEPEVTIRGFDQDNVLILLDGIPIASPFFGYVDLNQIPIESVAKIKVIKGSASALYGANTLGGVINIITKKAGDKPQLEIGNSFSEHDTRSHTLNYGTRSEDLSFVISGGHSESNGFTLSKEFESLRNEDGGVRDNSYHDRNGISLKLGLERFEKHNPILLFNYIDNEKGIPPSASSSNPRFWRFTEWKRWMVALADESEITDNLSIKGRVFYDKYDNTIDAYDDATYSTQLNASSWTSIYDEYAFGTSVYLNFEPNDMHALKGAVNFKKDVHKEQDDMGEPWETYEIHTYSFGLEDDIKLNEKLSLSAGMSYDVFDQIKTYTARTGSVTDAFNPGLTVNYSLQPETLIFASASQKTRFPTMNHLFSSTSGNPDLNEQRNCNWEVGVGHDFSDSTTAEVSYFYNNVEDLIERASKNDLYLNISKAIFEGVEANISTKIGKYLSGQLSYAYLDARDKNPSFLGRMEGELPYVPAHKADLELNYLTDFGLSCTILGTYNGRRYYYDSTNTQHALGGYFVWNLKISQEFLENWEGSFSVENILDRNYQEEEGYPQPGRTFLFGIKGTF